MLRRYLISDGDINKFPDEIVPLEIKAIFMARWMQGSTTLEWLLANPAWYDWIEVCKVAYSQAEEFRAKNAPA